MTYLIFAFYHLLTLSLLEVDYCHSIAESDKSGFFCRLKELQQCHADKQQQNFLSITESKIFNCNLAG